MHSESSVDMSSIFMSTTVTNIHVATRGSQLGGDVAQSLIIEKNRNEFDCITLNSPNFRTQAGDVKMLVDMIYIFLLL